MLRIYADFNALDDSPLDPERTAVYLHTYGSVRDLAAAGVRLQEGMPLIVWDASDDDEDLEGHGIVRFDRTNRRWFLEFDEVGVRYVPAVDRGGHAAFVCARCGAEIADGLNAYLSQVPCPSCGVSLASPVGPPAP